MPRYIAFLRAINVGGHVVKMDHLRRLFEELSLAKVETFIASGNVIFESRAKAHTLEKRIERHLREALGYEVATFLRSARELAAVVEHRPFPQGELDAEGNVLYAAFLQTPPTADAAHKVTTLCTPVDDFHVHEREVYWLRRRSVGESEFTGAVLERLLGMPATMRNMTTVRKLAVKYCG